jgi:predicted ATPase
MRWLHPTNFIIELKNEIYMPGIHLSKLEQQLQKAWNAEKFGDSPLLKSIEINANGGAGLRGIKSLRVDFDYPVTFFTGQNGAGKSTLLALAALAYHGVPGHMASLEKNLTAHEDGDFTYFTFRNFFHRGPGDAAVKDVALTWRYDENTPEVSLIKKTDKWMRYERRPKRAVEFLGISRAVPAIELSYLRSNFNADIAGISPAPLTVETRRVVEKILGRQYPKVEEINHKKFKIRRTSESGYTSFNMGAGEDSLIALLAQLSQLPKGSLVVIDEVETALHPAAQRKLVEALLQLSWERKLQIIGSTHSHHIIDNLPRVARKLIVREQETHRIVVSPTTMLALSEISEQQNKELLIICEDLFAASLITTALSAQVRKRVDIQACGANSELARYARSHLRIASKARCLIVWDGDVSIQEAKEYLITAKAQIPDFNSIDKRLTWRCLPSGKSPEKWALEVCRTKGLEDVVREFGLNSEGQAIDILDSCGLDDVHDIPYDLAQATGLKEDDAAQRLVRCSVALAKDQLQPLIDQIQQELK